MATLQAAAPLVSKPLIGFTYRATVATFPGAFLLLVSSVALPCACALFAVTWGLKGRDVAALGVPSVIGSLQRTFLKALQSNLFHILGQISLYVQFLLYLYQWNGHRAKCIILFTILINSSSSSLRGLNVCGGRRKSWKRER